MLDRVAISVAPLRIICAAVLMLLIVRVDFFASALAGQVRGEIAGSTIRCTHPIMRAHPQMRTLGLHHRYMMRDDVGRRRLLQLDQ